MLRVGSRTIIWATLPLSAALALDTFVVCAHALQSFRMGFWIAGFVFCTLTMAWLAYPALARALRTAAS